MYYRRKIILALMQLFGGELEKIRLQKLLFLFTHTQQKTEYDFIPYKFGCFSYSANADLTTMVTKGMLSESESDFKRLDDTDYLKQLKESDLKNLKKVRDLYGKMSANALMKHTYVNFPYWATNSIKAQDILSESEYNKVLKSKASSSKIILFTIGYEGISLEEYLNRLLKNDVKILVDVRCNPFSMKYGFNKNQLFRFCENVGIKYVHIPEVGIKSDKRQELNSQKDYDLLFEDYKKENLTKTQQYQNAILDLLKTHKRIALTCFEANICQCHRKHLAEAIEKLPQFNYEVKHI
jgi:uncharacterized protein (DUF488 family)